MINDYEEIHIDENETKAYVNPIPLENDYENTVGWQQRRQNNVPVDTTISQQFSDKVTAKKFSQLTPFRYFFDDTEPKRSSLTLCGLEILAIQQALEAYEEPRILGSLKWCYLKSFLDSKIWRLLKMTSTKLKIIEFLLIWQLQIFKELADYL